MVGGVIAIHETPVGVRYATDHPGRWSCALVMTVSACTDHARSLEMVRKQTTRWLTEHHGSSYFCNWVMQDQMYTHKIMLYFRHRKDAMMFRLSWHGEALRHVDD